MQHRRSTEAIVKGALNAIVLRARRLWSYLIVILMNLASKSRIGRFIFCPCFVEQSIFSSVLTYTSFYISLYFSTKSLFTSIIPFSFCLSQQTQNSSFWLFFSSFVSRPKLHLDGYPRNWSGFVASSHCHFAIIHPHVIHSSFTLFDVTVSENKLLLICLMFTGTLNQLHFTLLFMSTSFCTIWHISFFISLFI
jgi:hypothetical protein